MAKKKDARLGTLWHPVDASPNEIAGATLTTPPPKQWRYERGGGATAPVEASERKEGGLVRPLV